MFVSEKTNIELRVMNNTHDSQTYWLINKWLRRNTTQVKRSKDHAFTLINTELEGMIDCVSLRLKAL